MMECQFITDHVKRDASSLSFKANYLKMVFFLTTTKQRPTNQTTKSKLSFLEKLLPERKEADKMGLEKLGALVQIRKDGTIIMKQRMRGALIMAEGWSVSSL